MIQTHSVVESPPRRTSRFNKQTGGDLIAGWEASGPSATAFAVVKHITPKTIYRWRKRLQADELTDGTP